VKIERVPFCISDWSKILPVEHKGETGSSFWRTIEVGNLRLRMVEYSSGYRADHWCGRGHVLLVLEGELACELKDGRKFKLTSGISFQVSDDAANPHLVFSEKGARVFIVD